MTWGTTRGGKKTTVIVRTFVLNFVVVDKCKINELVFNNIREILCVCASFLEKRYPHKVVGLFLGPYFWRKGLSYFFGRTLFLDKKK